MNTILRERTLRNGHPTLVGGLDITSIQNITPKTLSILRTSRATRVATISYALTTPVTHSYYLFVPLDGTARTGPLQLATSRRSVTGLARLQTQGVVRVTRGNVICWMR